MSLPPQPILPPPRLPPLREETPAIASASAPIAVGPLPPVTPPPPPAVQAVVVGPLPRPTPPPTHSSVPPAALPSIAPAVPSTRRSSRIYALSGAGLALAIAVVAAAFFAFARRGPAVDERAVVRVVSGTSRGTGFFVEPAKGDDGVLVATAAHVVETGNPIVIERVVRIGDKESYVEAYPDTELVASDPEADLAVVRIRGLPASRVTALPLAKRADKDEPVVSAGFPASSIAARVGLIKKEGKLLDLTKLPVVDRAYRRLVRDNAIDGLIVSTDLEPGFSGGPTCNGHGQVVGVNVLKDDKYRGQNGAVSATLLEQLVAGIGKSAAPSTADVEAMLRRVQDQHLLLPVDDRNKVRADELVTRSQLPHLAALGKEIRSLEHDGTERAIGSAKMTGRAMVGMLLARLPGRSLETLHATSTQQALADCEGGKGGIGRFLGDLDGVSNDGKEAECAALAVRPLAWDLTAGTLEWAGTPREYAVTKIDEVDADAHVYRASVRASGLPTLIPVHVAWEAGKLRFVLFDAAGRLYGLDGSRGAVARDFEGKWVGKAERRADAATPGVESETEEHLTVTVTGTDDVTVHHTLRTARFPAKSGVRFACNHDTTIVAGATQTLSGKLHNGVVTGSSKQIDVTGDGCSRCGLCPAAAKLFVLKLVDGRLVLSRSNGVAAPEQVELVRE